MEILIIFKKKHSYLSLIFQFIFSLALLSNMPTRFTAKKCAWQWNSRVRWRKFGAFLSDMLCTASRHTFCLLMVRNEREDCPTEMGTVEKEWNNNKFRIIRIPRWAMMGWWGSYVSFWYLCSLPIICRQRIRSEPLTAM